MKKRASVLRSAEAAFTAAVDRLLRAGREASYRGDLALLSRDARRLGLILLTSHLFPEREPFSECGKGVPSSWTEMNDFARSLSDEARHEVTRHFEGLDPVADPNAPPTAQLLSEMGFFYERMKNYEACLKNSDIVVRSSRTKKKRSGTFFTPLKVCDFMVARTLDPLAAGPDAVQRLRDLKLLDPAMGTGQFLLAACEYLVKTRIDGGAEESPDPWRVLTLRRLILRENLYGIDLDGEHVEVARYLFSLYTACAEPELPGLREGDALIADPDESGAVFGEDGLPDRIFVERDLSFDGFDAIVGNPPYVASKNVSMKKYKALPGGASQLDFYLLFIQKYAATRYLRLGGAIAFIVPDPVLLRANGEGARTQLLKNLDLELLLHVKGIFPRTSVANVIFLARRSAEDAAGEAVSAARLENPSAVRAFRNMGDASLEGRIRKIPKSFFEKAPRKEYRYLQDEADRRVLAHLDGNRPAKLNGPGIIVRPLQALCRAPGAIFRGEETGKEKIRALCEVRLDGQLDGDGEDRLPMILGGENVGRYRIRDDALFIDPGQVKKDRDRYANHKLVIQKSTGRIVAALDTRGYVIPQSVYGVLVDDPRIGYPFLLAQLNSRLHTYYMHLMFTGYKLVQPQLEVEDIRQIPVMVPEFDETRENRTSSLDAAKSLFNQYLRTDDPGWILEFVDDGLNLGPRGGSAMIHDLLDFLGTRMIAACENPEKAKLPPERLEWLLDLVVYKVYGLSLEEIETVESFYGVEDDIPDTILPEEGEIPEPDSTPLDRPAPPVFGESN